MDDQPQALKPVLILDDDAAFRDLVATIFQSKGFSVIQARSPKDASALMTTVDPLMAVVDYRLPEIDGMTWIGQLRDMGRNFPIVFISAAWCDEKTFNWLRNILRVALILRKPIVPELFWQQIEGLLPANVLEKASEYQRAKNSFSANLAGALTDEDEQLLAEAGEEALLAQLRQLKSKLETQQKLNQARLNYIADLKAAWEELSKLVGDAQKDPGNAILLNDARMLAHKLRGTAGSLGFTSIGEGAGKVEDLLQALDPTDTLQEVVWWEIIRLLAAGTTEIAESSQALAEQNPEAKATSDTELRAMIVSPSQSYRAAVKEISSQVALAVEFAETLAEAADKARRTVYDAILVDLAVDSLANVLDTTAKIRMIPGQSSVPFGFAYAESSGITDVDLAFGGCSHLLPPDAGAKQIQQCFEKLFAYRTTVKRRVLTVDDDEVLTKFIATILEGEGLLVRQLNKPIQILETVEDFDPDLLLLDVIMPGLSGYDVCRMLRATEKFVQLPIVFLTSKNDQAGRAAAFQAGADDFLSKPVLPDELLTRVRGQLEHANTSKGDDRDRLTNCLTRKDFMLAAADSLASCKQANQSYTLCMLSIDDFVNISIDYSLFTAEETVKALGDLIHAHFKAEDVRGRFGDDSFVLAFADAKQNVIGRAIERLLAEFSALEFGNDVVGTFSCTFSAGLSDYPNDGETIESLLKAANSSLLTGRREHIGAVAFTR